MGVYSAGSGAPTLSWRTTLPSVAQPRSYCGAVASVSSRPSFAAAFIGQ